MVETKQKYRIGQKVRVATSTYRCSGCGNNHSRYFYGGQFSETPLQTRGRVIEVVDSDKVNVTLANGKNWAFQPSELEFLMSFIEPLPGIETIENHPLIEMAEQTPVFVVNGKVYAGKEEIGSVENLDQLALGRIDGQLETVRQNYATQVWREIGLEKRLGSLNLDIPNLIDAQIFPYLRAEEYEGKIEGLIGETTQTQQIATEEARNNNLDTSPLVRGVLTEISAIKEDTNEGKLWDVDEEAKIRTKKQSAIDRLLGYHKDEERPYESGIIQAAVGRANFAIINGEAKYLVSRENGNDFVTVEGNGFEFGNMVDLATVKNNYRRVISNIVRKQVLETKFSEEEVKKEITQRTAHLGKFAGIEKYEEKDFGFMKKGGNFYVFVKLPEFVMKCPWAGREHRDRILGTYYHSPESLIAAPVIKSNGVLKTQSIYRYYPEQDKFKDFCIGNIKLAESGENNGEIIAKNLLLMRRRVMQGHSADWYKGAPQYNEIDTSVARQKIESGVLSLEGAKV